MWNRRPLPKFLVLLALAVLPVNAQLAPAPDAPPQAPPPTRQSQSAARQAVTHAPSNAVNLYFAVRGPDKKPVTGLTQADCTVEDNGIPQMINHFTAPTDQPLTLGLLLDTSVVQQGILPVEQRAATAFLRHLLGPRDEAFVLGFDVDVTLLSDLTSSLHDLTHAIDNAQINAGTGSYAVGTVPPIGRLRRALVYDAVLLAARHNLLQEPGRNVLVLLTDGVDAGSQTRLKTAIEAVQKANAVVYVLLTAASATDDPADEIDAAPMRKLARATGGQVSKIGHNGRKMQAALDDIAAQLRTQHLVVYTPSPLHPRERTGGCKSAVSGKESIFTCWSGRATTPGSRSISVPARGKRI